MPEHSEADIYQGTIRATLKPMQEEGVRVVIENGKTIPVLPLGVSVTTDQATALAGYFNAISPELAGVTSQAAGIVASALENFQSDPKYTKDMIVYGPSLEDDFAASRADRLLKAKQAVTAAQQTAKPGPERLQTNSAAIFAREHLADLGLNTTINFLRALK